MQLTFGKHKGKTLEWVYENDNKYYNWCKQNLHWLKPHIDSFEKCKTEKEDKIALQEFEKIKEILDNPKNYYTQS